MEGQSNTGVKQEWTCARDEGVDQDWLGWRSRVGNGQTNSGVLTSRGYRSQMAESDWGSSWEEGMKKSRTGDGHSNRSNAVGQL